MSDRIMIAEGQIMVRQAQVARPALKADVEVVARAMHRKDRQ